jgi:uncharacterized protein YdeI (YjbR/CyaY-like superfamily)
VRQGDTVTVQVRPAPETPPELLARIAEAGLEPRWAALTGAQRRALSAEVFAAKTQATRTARVERAVAALRQRK